MSTTKSESEFKHVRIGPEWSGEFGPIYEVPLIDDLPLTTGPLEPGQLGMRQALPSRGDLDCCRRRLRNQGGDRIVAGFEVLLSKFMKLNEACIRLLTADHPDHFAARLSPSEFDALEMIKEAVIVSIHASE